MWWRKFLVKYLKYPKYWDYSCRFQKWHPWVMVFVFSYKKYLSMSKSFCGSFTVQISVKIFKPLWSFLLKDEGLGGFGLSMSMVLDKEIYFVKLRFYIWFIMTLYYKMRQLFYYKMRPFYYKMLQFRYKMQQLLQNATFIANCVGQSQTVLEELESFFCRW